jgi:hypothetical protein
MNLLGAPRQPFVGLAMMAGVGIIFAEFLPLSSLVLLVIAIGVAICAFVVLRWPNLIATYAIVGFGVFLVHGFRNSNTEGQQLVVQLGNRPRVLTATGFVISEPKIAPNGFATFLLKLESIEFEGRNQPTRAVWQVRWRGNPEFGDELRLSGIAEPIAPPRNPGEFDMRSYLARRDVLRILFVRYPEDGAPIDMAAGTRFCVRRRIRARGCKTRFAADWRTRPTCEILSAESRLVLGTKRLKTSKNRSNKLARFTSSLSPVCTWESLPGFYGCWRWSHDCRASGRPRLLSLRFFSMRR